MSAPTSLLGMVDDRQFGTLVVDVYEHIPSLLYPASVSVYSEMRTDSRLRAIIDGYALQLRRAQWQLDGSGCRPEVTQLVADCLGLNVVGQDRPSGFRRRGVSWNDHLRSALLSQVFGHYAFEMQAEVDGDGRARLAALAERIPATISNIHADPRTGALLGIDQQVTGLRRRGPQIPADRLVFYSRNREGASWQGVSLLRAAYRPWLLKAEMLRVAAIMNRRWGAGVAVAEALPGTNPTPGQLAEAQRMASAARAGDQAGAAVPPNFTMKIVGLTGSVPDTVAFIRFLNQEIATSVLMPHLDLGTSESGSRALGTAFIDSWTLALESEAESVADATTRQAAARIVDWNWGEDEPVPRVVVSGIGSRREVTAESLQLLLNSGALAADPGLEAWVRREYRLPERQDAPKPLPAGPPAKVPARGEAVAAAAPSQPPTDVEALDAAHDQAVTEMTGRWQNASGPLVTALAAAVAAETAGGALAGLAGLAVPASATAALTGVVSAGLLAAATSAAAMTAVEVAPIRQVDATLDAATRARLGDLARGVVDLIVGGYRSAASRVAMAHSGADEGQVRAAVADALTDLSQPKSAGLVAGSLSDAALTAQGVGREQVLGALPDGTRFKAGETRDKNTCVACREADGTEYPSLDGALAARPTGRNPACAGGLRCRGFIYALVG
ncbi:phage portal protein family protein [Micromonospora sediminicola]|uniref:phage portal protein family protein n=1 Tax=Micromonospora sediminicola TaxID=946078 RepID=UPI0037A6BD9A